jgi:hypothetical protein
MILTCAIVLAIGVPATYLFLNWTFQSQPGRLCIESLP